MRRGFVRCLWGVPSKSYKRNAKVINLDLGFAKYNPFDQPFTTYVFGESNLELLHKHGVDNCKLLSKDISLWDWRAVKGGKVDQYGHKLATLQAASEDFDEFVFLDWDCMACKSLPTNFWEGFQQKEVVQAHLRSYSTKARYIQKKGAIWRKTDINKRPCASFIYIRGKEIANKIYDTFLADTTRSDEKSMALVTDEMMSGWDIKKYWEMFEPDYFALHWDQQRGYCFSKELLGTKQATFLHLNRHNITSLLKSIETVEGIENQKELIGKLLTEKVEKFHSAFI